MTEVLTRATFVYRLCQLTTGVFLGVFGGWRTQGRENVPDGRGVILAANHQSFLDIPLIALGMGRRHVCFVARDSLARSRFLAFVMRQCGAVLVRRGSSDREALRAMMEHLERGDVVSIFPEGTRTKDGSVGEFQKGALWLATKSDAAVVPVGIDGTFRVLPRDAKRPRRARMRISFGPPIERSELSQLRERVIELATPTANTGPATTGSA